jgi:hypothetical protein
MLFKERSENKKAPVPIKLKGKARFFFSSIFFSEPSFCLLPVQQHTLRMFYPVSGFPIEFF